MSDILEARHDMLVSNFDKFMETLNKTNDSI